MDSSNTCWNVFTCCAICSRLTLNIILIYTNVFCEDFLEYTHLQSQFPLPSYAPTGCVPPDPTPVPAAACAPTAQPDLCCIGHIRCLAHLSPVDSLLFTVCTASGGRGGAAIADHGPGGRWILQYVYYTRAGVEAAEV